MDVKITDINPETLYPKPKVWSSLISLSPKSKIENLKEPKYLEHITNIFLIKEEK